ncbi:MAG: branched-chain amino acid transaminase [Acidobacteriota bacterium]
MSFDKTKWVWMNGEMVEWHQANFHVSSHALHYGTGVFEGMRCYETDEGAAVFRMDAHLDRLYTSASVYGLDLPYSQVELANAVCEVIERNGFNSCYIRPICFFGSNVLGLVPRNCPVEVVVFAWEWAPLLGQESLEKGVRITVSPWTKFHSRMMPTTAKASGQYLNSILAVRDAQARGFDEAILLDEKGNLAEGPGENLFIVSDNKIFTNDESSSILMGITRDAAIELAEDLGYRVKVCKLTLNDLMAADEAFFTGTAAEITPIREVDFNPIGDGTRGKVTHELQQAFFAAVQGKSAAHRKWLHFVARPNQPFLSEPLTSEAFVSVGD